MNTDQELERLNALTEQIIGCAIEVHRCLGPGLLEKAYEAAMCLEMDLRHIAYERQGLRSRPLWTLCGSQCLRGFVRDRAARVSWR